METRGNYYIFVIILHLVTLIVGDLYLERLSRIYLPHNFINGTAQFEYDADAIEQFTYDSDEKIIYTAGKNIIQVINIADVRNPTIVFYRVFSHMTEVTDIEFCGGFVIVTRKDKIRKERGFVDIYRRYDSYRYRFELLKTIIVGSGPDDIRPTSDCRKILIALEGEVYGENGRLIDPLGGIGVITFRTSDLSGQYAYKMVDFTPFVSSSVGLIRNGTRFVYRSGDNTIAQDLEPESITLNDDETTAYISLQENNAIAEFDMATDTINRIHPLGFKNWRYSRLDASDQDIGTKTNIRPWPVYGMYQPDSIRYMNVNGRGYIVSANEGDSKDFSDEIPNGWSEESRVGDLRISNRSPILAWANANGFRNEITAPTNLGRLHVSNQDGRLPVSNEHNNLFTFGARSFSIWRAGDMEQLFDSGSDFEDAVSRVKGVLFNSDPGDADSLATSTMDTVSDDKGPEPETIEIGEYRGRKLIFVGFEEPGGILFYSIGQNVRLPRLEDIWMGITETVGTWKELYRRTAVSELDVEDLRFIPQTQSPINEPLLIASGSVSGTLSIFQIKDRNVGFTCKGKPSGLYRDPADCNKYFNCHEGTLFRMSCPGILFFNQVLGYCDWPLNVVC